MVAMSAYRDTSPAPGEDEHLSLALANSRRNSSRGPVDELDGAASLRAWLGAHGLAAAGRRCRAGDVAAFRELRDAVREVLLARIEARVPDREAVAIVNRAAAAVPLALQLDWPADGPREVSDSRGVQGAALAGALVAADAIELVTGSEHAALRVCEAPGCVRFLLRDHPRRRWCSTRCGDRVRASRYYRRRRRTRSGERSA